MSTDTPAVRIDYVLDAAVDDELDRQLRDLLSTCFTGSAQPVFQRQRHFRIQPRHRWLARDAGGRLVGQIAVHDLSFGTTAGDLRVAGVAEVCVHPDQRGQGLARRMLDEMHRWTAAEGFPFATLFGDPRIYGGRGYRPVENAIRHLDAETGEWVSGHAPTFLVRPLTDPPRPWPSGPIDLRGPRF